MKNLVVFLYFVFLFKLAFAQSLPSLPGLEGESSDNLIPEYVEVPALEEDPMLDGTAGTGNGLDGDNFELPGFADAPPAPTEPKQYDVQIENTPVIPVMEDVPALNVQEVAEPSLEIDPFKKNSFDNKANDNFAQELQVEDNFENVTIDTLLKEDNFEIEVSKEQFPTTPSLHGFKSNQDRKVNAVERGKEIFKTQNVEEKESEVLEALFKSEDTIEIAPENVEVKKADKGDDGLDKTNDFEKSKNGRVAYKSVTYSEDQLVDHLIKAAMMGNKSAVLGLLHSGRNPNAQNKFGETPLMASIYNGHNTITEILLAEGANPNIIDSKGNTALHVAVSKQNYFAVEQLIKNGAVVDPRNKSNDTPLLIATLSNYLDIVDLLIRNGADVNKSNDDGLTPLHVATFNSNIEIVKYLLYVGANANMINRNGFKPYDLAYGKNLDIARLLAGYTGQQKYVSNDLPGLIQQSNNISDQADDMANSGQQFSLFPESYTDETPQDRVNARQTAWWAAKNNNVKPKPQTVMPVENANIYNPQREQRIQPQMQHQQLAPVQVQQVQQIQQIPVQSGIAPAPVAQYSAPQQFSNIPVAVNPAPVISAPQQAVAQVTVTPQIVPERVAVAAPSAPVVDYNNISVHRASSSNLTNVSAISNTYVPSKKPANIINQNINFIGSNKTPKSDVYGNKDIAHLSRPKSMMNRAARTPSYNQAAAAAPQKRILRYSELSSAKKMSWDRNLEKWLRASAELNRFSPRERQVWEKQRTILQSVYQDQFRNQVERAKRKLAMEQRSSNSVYGVRVTPIMPSSSSGANRRPANAAPMQYYSAI